MNPVNSCLLALSQEGDGPSVYFVHPAGGHVICYRHLARFLKRPLYAFQAPALNGGEEPHISSVETLAGRYLEELKRHQPQGPYYLGAWSTGALVAYEMAYQLICAGEEVTRLFVLDSPSPHDSEEVTEVQTLTWFLEDRAPNITCGTLEGLSLTDKDSDNLCQAIGLLPEQDRVCLDGKTLERHYQVFRSMIKAGRAYQAPQIDVDIVLCRARDEIVEEFAHHPHRDQRYWGWEFLTRKRIVQKLVNGTHYSFLQDSLVWETALFINRLTQTSSASRWSLA